MIHSKISEDIYQIRDGEVVLATAKRIDGGFLATLMDGSEAYESPTMRGLKDQIEAATATWSIKQPSKYAGLSVEDARRLCGISHGGIRHYVEELREFQPHVPRRHYGHAVQIMNYTDKAAYPWGAYEKAWLERNRKLVELVGLREVDYELYEATGRIEYLEEIKS